jgi:hypothetical protein
MERIRETWNRRPLVSPSIPFLIGVGLMGAAASFLVLGQITSSEHPNHTVWYAVALGLLVLGAIAIVVGAVEGISQWGESRRTPIEVCYDPDDPQCRQVRAAEADQQLRVRVRNLGRIGLNHVRARLDLEGGYSHWLRLEHDNVAPYHRSAIEGEILPALGGFALYFDVAFLGRHGTRTIEYADDYLRANSETSADSSREVTIQVWGARESDGRTVPPAIRRFRLVVIPSPLGEALGRPEIGREINLEPSQ